MMSTIAAYPGASLGKYQMFDDPVRCYSGQTWDGYYSDGSRLRCDEERRWP